MALSASELAQSYGWALSMLKSDKSLWNTFNAAVKGQWSPDKFVAKLKTTGWWKKTGESVRQYQFLKASDPATLTARRNALSAQVNDAASQMGASLSAAQRKRVVENSLMFGWNESQLRDALGTYTRAVHGVYQGQAGNDAEDLRQAAWRNGISLSNASLQSWTQNIAKGNSTVDHYKQVIRKQAQTLAPGYAAELNGGMDLYDIAQAYIGSKAKILELNPADVDLFDKDVRKALSGRGADGKPATMSLSQFEDSLRQSPAWLKTKDATDQAMTMGRKVLTDFGFIA